MEARTAVLFLTHHWNDIIRLKFERLRSEIGSVADVFILMQKSEAAERAQAEGGSTRRALALFDASALPGELGYAYAFADAILPGSVHFTVMAFSRRNVYDHYFLIEYDVDFSGNWRDFIATVLKASPDFASLHFFTPRQKPDWGWWRVYRPADRDRGWALDEGNLLRSFNPVYCLSRHAAQLIDAAHRDGWHGHHELILATVLSHRGCRVVDLARLDDFCIGSEQDPDASRDALSTVRWRPDVTQAEFLSRSTGRTLFHPVKDSWCFDGRGVISIAASASDAMPRS